MWRRGRPRSRVRPAAPGGGVPSVRRARTPCVAWTERAEETSGLGRPLGGSTTRVLSWPGPGKESQRMASLSQFTVSAQAWQECCLRGGSVTCKTSALHACHDKDTATKTAGMATLTCKLGRNVKSGPRTQPRMAAVSPPAATYVAVATGDSFRRGASDATEQEDDLRACRRGRDFGRPQSRRAARRRPCRPFPADAARHTAAEERAGRRPTRTRSSPPRARDQDLLAPPRPPPP